MFINSKEKKVASLYNGILHNNGKVQWLMNGPTWMEARCLRANILAFHLCKVPPSEKNIVGNKSQSGDRSLTERALNGKRHTESL